MSRSTTDAVAAFPPALARLRRARADLGRAWRGARGRQERHVVYVQAQGVMAWRAGAPPRAADPFDSFAAWCAARPGVDAWLRVSGELVHSLAVDPALPLADAQAVRRYARQQFAHYHGPQAAGWPLAVWSNGPQRGACAMHGLDLAALQAQAGAHDVRLRGVAPVWSAGLAALAAERPEFGGTGRHALLLVEGAAATWVVADGGVVVSLRQRFADAPDADAVARLLAALVRESPPLAGPPVLAGWGIAAPASVPADVAVPFGDFGGAGAMAAWVLAGARDTP